MATLLTALGAAAVLTTNTTPTMGNFNRYNAASGALSVTLPALSGLNVGARCAVQKYSDDASAYAVTFTGASSDKFDNGTSTSLTLNQPGEQYELQVVSISGTKRWKAVSGFNQTATATGRSSTLIVAASNSSGKSKAGADYVCDGTDDDLTINAALTALPSIGGTIKLLDGDYYLGSTSTSFVNINTEFGGITLESSGKRRGAIVHVPGGTSAPMAVRMAVYQNPASGPCTVRDLHITADGTQSTPVVGIWAQCNGAVISDCVVGGLGGHGFVIDGAPTTSGTSVTAPTQTTYEAVVRYCTAQSNGQAIRNGGNPGDGFVVTGMAENSILYGNFVYGGDAQCAALLTTGLTASSNYTTLAVTPLSGALTNGQKLLIGSGGSLTNWQVVTVSANASVGATSISVTSFTAAFSAAADKTSFVAGLSASQMVTRIGFRIEGAATQLDHCHPYKCHQTGALSTTGGVFITGGEYESNGWTNIHHVGTATPNARPARINGVYCYGDTVFAHISCFASNPAIIANNIINANKAVFGITVNSGDGVVIANNNVRNAVGSFSSFSALVDVEFSANCLVTSNTFGNDLSPTAGTYCGINAFGCTDTLVTDNILTGLSGTGLVTVAVNGTNVIGLNNVGDDL